MTKGQLKYRFKNDLWFMLYFIAENNPQGLIDRMQQIGAIPVNANESIEYARELIDNGQGELVAEIFGGVEFLPENTNSPLVGEVLKEIATENNQGAKFTDGFTFNTVMAGLSGLFGGLAGASGSQQQAPPPPQDKKDNKMLYWLIGGGVFLLGVVVVVVIVAKKRK